MMGKPLHQLIPFVFVFQAYVKAIYDIEFLGFTIYITCIVLL